jgi:hypothetical protein
MLGNELGARPVQINIISGVNREEVGTDNDEWRVMSCRDLSRRPLVPPQLPFTTTTAQARDLVEVSKASNTSSG